LAGVIPQGVANSMQPALKAAPLEATGFRPGTGSSVKRYPVSLK